MDLVAVMFLCLGAVFLVCLVCGLVLILLCAAFVVRIVKVFSLGEGFLQTGTCDACTFSALCC